MQIAHEGGIMCADSCFRDYVIQSGGIISLDIFTLEEEISRMKHYLETMEGFIKNQEEEVNKLKGKTNELDEEQRVEFWSFYYPVHWEEIFARNLRFSFLVSLISFTESKLNTICQDVEIILEVEIKSSDLKGSVFSRSRKYLECFGKFSKPVKEEWELLESIYDVRNSIVHNGGFIQETHKSAQRLRQFIKQREGITESNNSIKIEYDFCFFTLEIISTFLKILRASVQELCEQNAIGM